MFSKNMIFVYVLSNNFVNSRPIFVRLHTESRYIINNSSLEFEVSRKILSRNIP